MFSDLPDELLEIFMGLPQMGPFTTTDARAIGARWVDLRRLAAVGLLRHPVRGVYCASTVPDDLDQRIAVLRLIVPPDCVVTDRTAGWLWGAEMILAPNDHVVTPRASVFAPPGRRLRNELSDSGERMLSDSDISSLKGLLVTTPLRTACDLGRLLHRDQALAGMDSLAALGVFTVEELCAEVQRFKGYRGVVQLRSLAPLVDPRAGSPGESVLRLRWLDLGLPRPRCQIEIPAPGGSYYLLDMGLEDRRFAAEFDGEEFHGAEHRDHDESRREWAREELRWTIVVARRHNVFGRNQDIHGLLRAGHTQALLALTEH